MNAPTVHAFMIAPDPRRPSPAGLAMAVAAAGSMARLLAPPIHAWLPLRAQALTGRAAAEVGVFDDLRPRAYAAVPAEESAEPAGSLLTLARDMSIPVLHGADAPRGAASSAIIAVDEDGAAAVHAGAASGATAIWIQPCVTVHCRLAVNPVDLLAAAGLLVCTTAGTPDWSQSLAYHVGHGQVWVNLRGREPHGVVEPGAEHDEVRDALVRLFDERLVDEAGSAPVARAVLKEAVYAGPWTWAAPDVVLIPGEGCAFSPAAIAGQPDGRVVRRAETLAPRPGWWGCAGPGAAARGETAALDILSVAPTVAAAMGLALPARAPAAVQRDAFIAEFWRGAPRPAASDPPSLSADDEQAVARRLVELGYIE